MAFEFTHEMAVISNNLWAITSAVGAGLCFLVLCIIGAVWSHPKARHHLDRVSFRIVVYALVANMFFGISSAVGGMLTGPGFMCGFSIFILQLTLQLSSWLLFSIALNLMLVIVFRVNGQKMEKYYIIGSCCIGLVLTIPPYAAGQYGYDVLEKDCWYTNDDKKQRLAWQIATQMAWTAMTVIGEVVASIFVMLFMLKHQRRLKSVYSVTNTVSNMGTSSVTAQAPQAIVANTYTNIILRVALYPAASCIVNLLSIFTAIHSTASDGIHDTTDYNILLLSDFLYGGRAIAYAILALLDPALMKGMRVLYFHFRYGPNAHYESSTSKTKSVTDNTTSQLQVHIELSTIQESAPPTTSDKKAFENTGMDSSHALEASQGLNKKQDGSFINFDVENGRGHQARPGTYRRSGVVNHARLDDLRKEEERAFKKQI